MSFVKFPPPRPLTKKETLDSLEHWKSQFKTFFKRDDTFRPFLRSDFTWDPSLDKYGFSGANAQEDSDNFEDFLNVLSGFLPHSYLTSRITKDTKCWEDIWNVIYTHYDCKISGNTLLYFESLNKTSDENHQQFYERLLQHARLHMAPAQADVCKLKITKPDEMSITIMNMVALQWLRKTDQNLINIVKTEYSTELKSGTQLANLVSSIAPNIDNLLSRYSNNSVQRVEVEQNDEWDPDDEAEIRFNRQNRRYQGRGGQDRFSSKGKGENKSPFKSFPSEPRNYAEKKNLFCPGCKNIAERQAVSIDFNHLPAKCPRKFVVRSIQEDFEDEDSEEFGNNNISYKNDIFTIPSFQTKPINSRSAASFQSSKVVLSPQESSATFNLNKARNGNKLYNECDCFSTTTSNNIMNPVSESKMSWKSISDMIRRVEGRQHIWNS